MCIGCSHGGPCCRRGIHSWACLASSRCSWRVQGQPPTSMVGHAAISSGKEGYLSMVLAWFCLMPPRASQSNKPVLLIIHYSLVTTSADAAAVQTVVAGMFLSSSHWCMAQPQSGQCSLLCLGCKCSQICRSQICDDVGFQLVLLMCTLVFGGCGRPLRQGVTSCGTSQGCENSKSSLSHWWRWAAGWLVV
jgi:hypothetical protein